MTFTEQIGVLVFLAVVVTTYTLAGRVLFKRFVRKRPISRWPDRLVLALAGIGLLCFAYGYFIEPYRLTVSRVKITSSKIPKDFGALKIAHISDTHSDPQPRLEQRLPLAIAAEHPDIIVFTGDAINSREGLPVFQNCLTELAAIAPTFVVKGNWDTGFSREFPLFAGTGAHELNATSVGVEIRGLQIWIAGLAANNRNSLDRALTGIPPDALKIFLYHYPDLIKEVAEREVDLYLAGHTHGGQVALPIYGALMTLSKYGKTYESGLFRERDTWLYVNRGIGMEGRHAPPVRFWAPPELTLIEVGSAQS